MSSASLHYSFLEKGGGLLAQAARNQTQGVEERYARGTSHSSRGMEGLCCSALTAETRGRLETWLEVFSIVRMAHLKAGNIPIALVSFVVVRIDRSCLLRNAGRGNWRPRTDLELLFLSICWIIPSQNEARLAKA